MDENMLQNNSIIKILFLLACLLISPASAQEILNIDHLARYADNWNDGVYDVQEVGENYYMACGIDGFRIIGWEGRDDEPYIVEIGHLSCPDARAIAASNNYAYVGTIDNGMYIIDITYPHSPWMVRRVFIDASLGFNAIKIEGNYAFLCCSPSGLNIVNISDPRSAYIYSTIPGYYDVKDIVLRDGLAFLACGRNGLAIFNMANLQSPQLLNTYVCPDSASVNGVAVSGGYAYLACDGIGLRIIDLNSLQMVANIDSLTDGDKIHLNQNFIFMTYGENHRKMALISYSNPLAPQTIGFYLASDKICNFSFGLYCPITANGRRGLRFINVFDPTQPEDMFSYSNYRRFLNIIICGETILNRNEFGIDDFDIANIEDIWLRGSLEFWRDYRNFRVVGERGYIAQDGDTGLIVLEFFLGFPYYYSEFIEHDCGVHSDVAIYGDYAYLVQPNGLRIVNISNHDSLWQAGFFEHPLASSKAIIFDHFLYVQENELNLLRIDISNPLNPVINCQWPLDQYCRNLKATLGKLFAITDQKLWIFDSTPPDSLRLLSETTLITEPGAYLHGLEYKRDHLFVAGDLIGLNVYYIGNPASPICTGYSRISDKAMGVTLTGNIAIVANYSNLDFYDCSIAADIGKSESALPDKFVLLSNFPNPFNAATQIRFQLTCPGHVMIRVYDILGREVSTLADCEYMAGNHAVIWDGSTNNGKGADSGVYFVRASAGGESQFIKVVLLK